MKAHYYYMFTILISGNALAIECPLGTSMKDSGVSPNYGVGASEADAVNACFDDHNTQVPLLEAACIGANSGAAWLHEDRDGCDHNTYYLNSTSQWQSENDLEWLCCVPDPMTANDIPPVAEEPKPTNWVEHSAPTPLCGPGEQEGTSTEIYGLGVGDTAQEAIDDCAPAAGFVEGIIDDFKDLCDGLDPDAYEVITSQTCEENARSHPLWTPDWQARYQYIMICCIPEEGPGI